MSTPDTKCICGHARDEHSRYIAPTKSKCCAVSCACEDFSESGAAHDEVGALLKGIGSLRGGKFNLYKPLITLEFYEHDDVAWLQLDRCKNSGEIVYRSSTVMGPDALMRCLRKTLEDLKASGAS